MANYIPPTSPVITRLLAPLFDAYAGARRRYACKELGDLDFLESGITRCISAVSSGRDFLQKHGDSGRKDTKDADDDPSRGKNLFTQRGCIACHLAPDDGRGGAMGPSLVGARDRFPADYLAASILVPNLTVSPNFHPNSITMKDGTVHIGFVEAGGSPEVLNLRVITGQIEKLTVKRDVNEQSMMPAGLILTPRELRDTIAYLSLPLEEVPSAEKKD